MKVSLHIRACGKGNWAVRGFPSCSRTRQECGQTLYSGLFFQMCLVLNSTSHNMECSEGLTVNGLQVITPPHNMYCTGTQQSGYFRHTNIMVTNTRTHACTQTHAHHAHTNTRTPCTHKHTHTMHKQIHTHTRTPCTHKHTHTRTPCTHAHHAHKHTMHTQTHTHTITELTLHLGENLLHYGHNVMNVTVAVKVSLPIWVWEGELGSKGIPLM